MKKYKTLFLAGCLALSMTACGLDAGPTKPVDPETQAAPTTAAADDTKATQAPADTTEAKPEDTKATEGAKTTEAPKETKAPGETKADKEEKAVITLADGKTTVEGGAKDCVFLEGKKVIIQKPGTYVVSGTLKDGQLRVEVTKDDKVEIEFKGVEIANTDGPAFYAVSADKVVIELKKDTTNILTDSQVYDFSDGDEEPNACLFSKDDLTIKGKGALIVNGNYNNGITTKDDLKISGGNITVKAAKNGIRGNDSITIKEGTVKVDAIKDGFKVSNEEDAEKGFFLMEGGTVEIDAGDDAIQAVTSVKIEGGTVTYRADGKDIKCNGTISVADGVMKEKTK